MILVTHQLQFLKHAKRIVVMNEGRVQHVGTFDQLMALDLDLLSLLRKDENVDDETKARALSQVSVHKQKQQKVESSGDKAKNSESKATGSVSWKVYVDYVRAGANWSMVIGLFTVTVSAQCFQVYQDFWLSNWTNRYEEVSTGPQNGNATSSEWSLSSEKTDIGIYVALILCLLTSAFARAISLFYLCLNCSKNLHDGCFRSLLSTPMKFFETTPLGQILNR